MAEDGRGQAGSLIGDLFLFVSLLVSVLEMKWGF